MSVTKARAITRWRRAILTAGATAAALGAAASPAVAAYDFHNGWVGSGYIEESAYEALRATLGWADSSAHKVEVAAADGSGLYGSWVDGWETACHSYAGTTTLKGLLRNPHTVAQDPMRGRVRVVPEIACGSLLLGPAVAEISPEISASFAIFRDQPASPPPAEVSRSAVPPSFLGANAALARRIETTTGTGWVVPARDHLCVVQPDPVDGYGSVCTALTRVKRSGLYIGLREDPRFGGGSATYVVPDGADLTATTARGETEVVADRQRLRAANGVFSVDLAAGTTIAVTG